MYKKTRAGLLTNLTGLGSPYEAPQSPDLELDCARISLADAVGQVIGKLGL